MIVKPSVSQCQCQSKPTEGITEEISPRQQKEVRQAEEDLGFPLGGQFGLSHGELSQLAQLTQSSHTLVRDEDRVLDVEDPQAPLSIQQSYEETRLLKLGISSGS